jgi:hypothetical protein
LLIQPTVDTRLKIGLILLVGLAVSTPLIVGTPAVASAVTGGFVYVLSDFTGPIPYNHSRLAVDLKHNEIYVLYQNMVRVFNQSGMEIYRFGDDLEIGQIVDVAVDQDGDILLLVYKDSRWEIVRCNYRGEPKSRVTLKGQPRSFADFSPNRMLFQNGNLYLASTGGLKAVVADQDGNFKKGFDLFSLFELEEKDRGNVEISGFNVDRDGNMLMTVPVLFRAYLLSSEGRITSFGRPGGGPGRFNIAAGIARDSKGNYLVVDKLKSAVLVFDKSFNFLTEFGYRGYKPGNLIYPEEVVVDGADRLYVTQMGKRGVSVFKLAY